MFCTNCGKQIPDDVKFCTECGSEVKASAEKVQSKSFENNTTVQVSENTNFTKSLKITGKRAGEDNFLYSVILIFLLLFCVGTWASWLVFFLLTLYVVFRIPHSVTYNTSKKQFVTNEKMRLKSLKKNISLSDIRNIRIRKVKLGFSLRHALSIPGEYFVFAFDTDYCSKNLFLWFQKEEELRSFQKIVQDVFSENGINMDIDENLSVLNVKDFYAQEPGEKEDFSIGNFIKKNLKIAVAAFAILLILGWISLASGSGIDAALDKMDSAVTRIEKIYDKYEDGKLTQGEFVSEYNKVIKDFEDAQNLISMYDDSDVSAKQYERLFKIMARLQSIK